MRIFLAVISILVALPAFAVTKDEMRAFLKDNPEVVMEFLKEHVAPLFDIVAGEAARRETAENEARMRREAASCRLMTLDERPTVGAANPAVRVTAFVNFACKFCGMNMARLNDFLKRHPDAAITFKTARWPQGHGEDAARIFLALGRLDNRKAMQFYELALVAMRECAEKGLPFLLELAAQTGADKDTLARDMRSEAVSKMLEEDAMDAQAAGMRGTPFTLVGGIALHGLQDDAALDRAYAMSKELAPKECAAP